MKSTVRKRAASSASASVSISGKYDDIIVGAGLFGCALAEHLAAMGRRVILIEKEEELLTRASFSNQARVHGGYHYPRSFLTGKRSQANFHRFIEQYAPAIVDNFKHYYAISRYLSQVSARQFEEFCARIGAPLRTVSDSTRQLFDSDKVEAVYEVEEFALDAVKIRQLFEKKLKKAKIRTQLASEVVHVAKTKDSIRVSIESLKNEQSYTVKAGEVWLCGYSEINTLLKRSELPLIPLRNELAEMCLVKPPDIFRSAAVTVMDGPFFSLMPFPAKDCHTLSHVRYTPHSSWEDTGDKVLSAIRTSPPKSHFLPMVRDASALLPCLSECVQKGSLWEIKSLIPKSEHNDSRPILFQQNHGLTGLHCIVGGKLDNVFDALEIVTNIVSEDQRKAAP